jgi:peroxiredoxin
VDHVPCIKAWAESLGGINYPLLSDFWPHGAIADKYGVLRTDGSSERAIFVIDKEGVIRYIDIHDIDDQPSNDVLRNILRSINPKELNVESHQQKDEITDLPKGGIIMYCTTWCPGCRKAHRWLNSNGLEFTEIDINKVPGAAEQVMKWASGNRTTPTFDIDDTIIVDWNESLLEEVLKEKGYLE